MPNLIRHKRGHHPPLMLSYLVLRNAGTRLSLRERDIAYSLNCYAGWTHEKIGSSLGVSRNAISASLQKKYLDPLKAERKKAKY